MQSLGREGYHIMDPSRPFLSVRDEDTSSWHTWEFTHNLRVEDWPVMSVEKMLVS
jgi:Cu2+-containing amine oxidase